MKMVNNLNVIRASGVLYNLHVKWQASDSEEEEPAGARASVQEGPSGQIENTSESSDSSENEGAVGPMVANPDAAPIQESCSTIF